MLYVLFNIIYVQHFKNFSKKIEKKGNIWVGDENKVNWIRIFIGGFINKSNGKVKYRVSINIHISFNKHCTFYSLFQSVIFTD